MGSKKKETIRPKVNQEKVTRIPKQRDSSVRYSFRIFDRHIQFPNTDKMDNNDCVKTVMDTLRSYESMTWNEVLQDGQYNHFVDKKDLEQFAQDRLTDLQMDDFDSIFRFRINGAQRLWGIKEIDIFYPIWWDPHHKICPSRNYKK